MKSIIAGLSYDTEKAKLLAEKGTGGTTDYSDWYEELYVTNNGRFFISYWGGATSKHLVRKSNHRQEEGSGIKVLSKERALDFIDSDCYNLDRNKIEEIFDIEEA